MGAGTGCKVSPRGSSFEIGRPGRAGTFPCSRGRPAAPRGSGPSSKSARPPPCSQQDCCLARGSPVIKGCTSASLQPTALLPRKGQARNQRVQDRLTAANTPSVRHHHHAGCTLARRDHHAGCTLARLDSTRSTSWLLHAGRCMDHPYQAGWSSTSNPEPAAMATRFGACFRLLRMLPPPANANA
eukprot:365978-Chlamydomonas_euryale.AAC.16